MQEITAADKITFHHFGLAVRVFTEALAFYKSLDYHCSDPLIDPLQNVEAIFCTSPTNPSVELIKPINKESPITNYLNKCNELICHTCYEVKNVSAGEALFPKSQAICVSKPKPAILFNNRFISFYYIRNVGLIELLQADTKQ